MYNYDELHNAKFNLNEFVLLVFTLFSKKNHFI